MRNLFHLCVQLFTQKALCFLALISLFGVAELTSCQSDNFNLCSANAKPYYYPALKYKGNFFGIKKYFYNNYVNVNGEKTTGIVVVKFQVNCIGKSGNFKANVYNLDYQPFDMNSEVVSQLVVLTKNLKDWIPATDETGNTIDSYKFFSFKIQSGHLQDILPK